MQVLYHEVRVMNQLFLADLGDNIMQANKLFEKLSNKLEYNSWKKMHAYDVDTL